MSDRAIIVVDEAGEKGLIRNVIGRPADSIGLVVGIIGDEKVYKKASEALLLRVEHLLPSTEKAHASSIRPSMRDRLKREVATFSRSERFGIVYFAKYCGSYQVHERMLAESFKHLPEYQGPKHIRFNSAKRDDDRRMETDLFSGMLSSAEVILRSMSDRTDSTIFADILVDQVDKPILEEWKAAVVQLSSAARVSRHRGWNLLKKEPVATQLVIETDDEWSARHLSAEIKVGQPTETLVADVVASTLLSHLKALPYPSALNSKAAISGFWLEQYTHVSPYPIIDDLMVEKEGALNERPSS